MGLNIDGRIRLKKLLFDSSKNFSLIRAKNLKKNIKKLRKIFWIFLSRIL